MEFTDVRKEKRNEGFHINVRLKLGPLLMGRTTIVILTNVAFGRKERLSRTTYANSDFAVGAHGLFVAAHLLSVTARKKKQSKIRQSVYQYTKISDGILEDIKALSFNT